MHVIAGICETTVALLVGLAGLGKLHHGAEAIALLRRTFRIDPPPSIGLVIPSVEIGIAIFAVARPGVFSASLLLALLIAVSAFLVLALKRSPGATCACFGALADVPLTVALARNGLLMLAAALPAAVEPTGGLRTWPTATVLAILLLVATSAAALMLEVRERSLLS